MLGISFLPYGQLGPSALHRHTGLFRAEEDKREKAPDLGHLGFGLLSQRSKGNVHRLLAAPPDAQCLGQSELGRLGVSSCCTP